MASPRKTGSSLTASAAPAAPASTAPSETQRRGKTYLVCAQAPVDGVSLPRLDRRPVRAGRLHAPAYLQADLAPEVSRQVAVDGNQHDLESYIRRDINRLYPELDKDLISIGPQWWDEMLPEWYPGYAKHIAAFLQRQESGRQRIYYCGDYLSQSHTGGACATGRTVTRLISRDLAHETQ